MKKFITTILTVLYILTSTGATLQLHYCMGNLADWVIATNQSATCEKCGMEKEAGKHNDCCRDEHKFFKDDTDQQRTEAGFQLLALLATALPPTPIVIQKHYFPAVALENPMSHAPPRHGGIAVYISNCAFLI